MELRKADPEWPDGFELLYAIDPLSSRTTGAIVLDLFSRNRKKSGEPTVWKDFRIAHTRAGMLPDPVDADLVPMMLGGTDTFSFNYSHSYGTSTRKALPYALALKVLPRAAAADRLAIRGERMQQFIPLAWDEGDPWRLLLEVRQDDRDQWAITGALARGEERMQLTEPSLILRGGFVIARNAIARLEDEGAFGWIEQLLAIRQIPFPDRERDAVIAALLNTPFLPKLDLDEPLRFEERVVAPKPALRISQAQNAWGEEQFTGKVLFDYGAGWVAEPIPGRGVWQPGERVFLLRDPDGGGGGPRTVARLGSASGRPAIGESTRRPCRASSASCCRRAGTWRPMARRSAAPAHTASTSSSGIDWFELRGEVDYGGATAKLPAAAGRAAPRRHHGAAGRRHRSACCRRSGWRASRRSPDLGDARGRPPAVPAEPGRPAGCAAGRAARSPRRRSLRARARAPAQLPGRGSRAAARGLRRHSCATISAKALGWMQFLREFGFGGCLADDMGVGKTAQVLALLEGRGARKARGRRWWWRRKSLMFNWRAEAARFTPKLRVLEHTGTGRATPALIARARPGAHHLRHAACATSPQLAEIEFDYVVLDEAQAIKNATTASAKAVRLLRGDHRLALSGTPVENHLGELWSLFEFLNPGMLGEAKVLQMAGGLARNPERGRAQLAGPGAAAVHPAAHQSSRWRASCRRRPSRPSTASSKPRSASSTTICATTTARRCWRESQREGMGKSKMHVLEALLRLRQAACHPGLLDTSASDEPQRQARHAAAISSTRSREEGHKALVFSQFTSLLAIVRERLDDAGIRYEYLDGADARPAGPRRALPERSRLRAVPDQPEGRRPGAEPDRGRVCVPARPLVESGGGGAGHRPRTASGRRGRCSPTG